VPPPNEALEFSSDDSVTEEWRECPQCGLISTLPPMQVNRVAVCPRCRHALWQMRKHPFRFVIACGLSGLLFYCLALLAPFLELSAYGRFQTATIETGPAQLVQQGYQMVGLVVLAVSVLFPGIKLGLLLTTLIGVETKWVSSRTLKTFFRWYGPITPWAMVDVYLLGFLVAYTRLIAIASVHLDTALYALIGLMLSMAAADAAMDPEAVWRALDAEDETSEEKRLEQSPPIARDAQARTGVGLIGCHCCDLVNRAEPGDRCRRCDTVLHMRKANSISRSWALLLAGALLFIPANIYPVMVMTELAVEQPYTIMGGIRDLLLAGLWPLAALVFFASITIPLLKLVTLGYMLVQTQKGSTQHLIGRTRAFRVIEFIGRWSMIDVFVLSLLVALVRFGQFANFVAEVGAPCFAAVVVLTMFAVEFFDPRLMWDAQPVSATSGDDTVNAVPEAGPA
jgi:paraquat-inducible protein A